MATSTLPFFLGLMETLNVPFLFEYGYTLELKKN